MYQGSCLCGGIELVLEGGIGDIIHCHCSLCRKNSGTAYATNGFILAGALKFTQGQELLNFYEFKPGRRRYFCRRCASPVYSANAADPTRLRLRLGILDSDIAERPQSHNFVSSRANWDEPDAMLPRYDGHEPGRT